jgi:protoporphyrin/coproporphyrin ferrochelatase
VKLAIILFNLGGPDSPEAVEPFLRNLFSDPAIIRLPWLLRQPLAWLIARRRAPLARKIYDHLGGRSPILEETQRQARALEAAVSEPGVEARTFVAMRCWHPFSDGTVLAVKKFAPDHVVALPLYPQYSTTTSASSLKDWDRATKKAGLAVPLTRICCYPDELGFIAAAAEKIRAVMVEPGPGLGYRLLLSAHGLPKKMITDGDPYQWQVERTARALVEALGIDGSPVRDWRICYQSRVGPLKWIGPATDAEIRRAGAEGKGVVIAPIAFVSEHSETLVELDIEYARLARESGVPDYRRAATVRTHSAFIAGLAGLVRRALANATGASDTVINGSTGRLCPAQFSRCGFDRDH